MPIPSTQRLYRCDKEFILDPVRAIVDQGVLLLIAAGHRYDARARVLGELQRGQADPAGRAVNEHGFCRPRFRARPGAAPWARLR